MQAENKKKSIKWLIFLFFIFAVLIFFLVQHLNRQPKNLLEQINAFNQTAEEWVTSAGSSEILKGLPVGKVVKEYDPNILNRKWFEFEFDKESHCTVMILEDGYTMIALKEDGLYTLYDGDTQVYDKVPIDSFHDKKAQQESQSLFVQLERCGALNGVLSEETRSLLNSLPAGLVLSKTKSDYGQEIPVHYPDDAQVLISITETDNVAVGVLDYEEKYTLYENGTCIVSDKTNKYYDDIFTEKYEESLLTQLREGKTHFGTLLSSLDEKTLQLLERMPAGMIIQDASGTQESFLTVRYPYDASCDMISFAGNVTITYNDNDVITQYKNGELETNRVPIENLVP